MRVADSRTGYVRFETISDSSKLLQWVCWRSSEVTYTAVDATHTKVTWRISFDRQLDPYWYFGPLERLAVGPGSGVSDHCKRNAAEVNVDRAMMVRVGALYLPVAAAILVASVRPRQQRMFAACLLSLLWTLPALLVLQRVNLITDWWRFQPGDASFSVCRWSFIWVGPFSGV